MIRQAGIPNGDAFLVQTPQIDAAREQLMAEQRQREMFAQREAMSTDQEMAKEFANVRDADMPEIMDKYNKYKQQQIEMMRNPRLQNNVQAYGQASSQAMQALGEVHGLINESKQKKQMGQDINRIYLNHPDKFLDSDDYRSATNQFMATPSSKLGMITLPSGKRVDISNPEGFMYQGSNTNWQPIEKTAMGTPSKTPTYTSDPTQSKDDPLSDEHTEYHFGNSPYAYKQSYMAALQTHAAGRDAGAAWDKLQTDDNGALVQHVNEMFNNISPERWKQMTGSEKPQNLEPQDPNNKAEQFASFKAKAYAVNAAINQTSVTKTNQGRLLQAKQQVWLDRNATSFKEKQFLQQANNRLVEGRQNNEFNNRVMLQGANEKTRDRVTNENFDMQVDAAKSLPAEKITATDGQSFTGHPIGTQKEIVDQFQFKNGSHPVVPKIYVDGKDYVGVATYKDDQGDDVVEIQRKPINALKTVFREKYTSGVKAEDVGGTPHHTPAAHPKDDKDPLGVR